MCKHDSNKIAPSVPPFDTLERFWTYLRPQILVEPRQAKHYRRENYKRKEQYNSANVVTNRQLLLTPFDCFKQSSPLQNFISFICLLSCKFQSDIC